MTPGPPPREKTMDAPALTPNDVFEAIRPIEDPELLIGIVDLGLV